MAASSYDAALARLLVHEGGYSNHPADPGGPTNFGITITDYRQYVKPGATATDVRAMTVGEAKRIYRDKYWRAQRCDELPAGVDYAVFDYGVNSGVGRSGKVLRRCLKSADNRSVVTDAVIAAARAADAKALIVSICDERLRFLQSLKTWSVFGKGWDARVAEVKAYALQLASGACAPAAAPAAASVGKGVVPAATSVQRGSAGLIVATGAAAAHHAQQNGADPAFIAGLIMAAALIAIAAWRIWDWRQERQQDKPA